MDLLPALTEDGIHTVLWSDPLLDEWERVIVRSGGRSAEAAAAVTAAIRKYFPDARVPTAAFAHLIDGMPGKDPDDRVHMAAAVAGRATYIVTYNVADFPAAPPAEYGVTVVRPDSYLSALFNEFSREIVATVVRLAGEKRKPPMTPEDLLSRLEKAGLGGFADAVRSWAVGPPGSGR